jgi:hypothetical protein
MEGLQGVRSEGFDKQKMAQTLAGLGKRRFLLHSVHEDEAVVFNTRWAMSYLAGPLTREQIAKLTAAATPAPGQAPVVTVKEGDSGAAPILPPSIRPLYVPASGDGITYYPRLIGSADLAFTSSRYDVDVQRSYLLTTEIGDGPIAIDWDDAEPLLVSADDLAESGIAGALYSECPSVASSDKNYSHWEKDFKNWLRKEQGLRLYRSKRFKVVSVAGESEGDFRIRMQQLASEQRDDVVDKLRKRYASKVTTLENRLLRAEQAVEREQQQSSKKKLDVAVSVGTAILGALLGRKRLSSTSAGKVGTAIKTASGARKEAGDVSRAKESAKKVRSDLAALNDKLEAEIDTLDTAFDAQSESLDELLVRPKTTDVHVRFVSLAWMPYRKTDDGRLAPAWQ